MAVMSPAVRVPPPRAMTTGRAVWFSPSNGVASRAACRLWLLAGKKLVLSCLAALVSDGKKCWAKIVAATQATTTTQRKRTENRPIAANNLFMEFSLIRA